MNIHTLSIVIALFGLALAFICAILGLRFGSNKRGAAVVLGAALCSIAVAVISVLVLGSVAWYSPGESHAVGNALAKELNSLGEPSTGAQAQAMVSASISVVEQRIPDTISSHATWANRFIVSIQGDTARTCVGFSQTTHQWGMTNGACY